MKNTQTQKVNFSAYEKQRQEIQNEINSQRIGHISFEVFEKSQAEKELLKEFKKSLK